MLELQVINLFILYSFLVIKLVNVLTFLLFEQAAQLRQGKNPVALSKRLGRGDCLCESACTSVSRMFLALEKEKRGKELKIC